MLEKSGPPGRITIVDKPGCLYYFGLFFILIGLLSALTAFFLAPPETEVTTTDRAITVLVGLLAAVGGAYFVFNSPRSQIVVEESGKKILVSRRGFQLREHETFYSDEIDDIYVIESDESENAMSYSLRMRHVNGEEIPLSLNWFKDHSLLEENANSLKKALSR
jgi:hypothetical protein